MLRRRPDRPCLMRVNSSPARRVTGTAAGVVSSIDELKFEAFERGGWPRSLWCSWCLLDVVDRNLHDAILAG
jgi:hypothetical protein